MVAPAPAVAAAIADAVSTQNRMSAQLQEMLRSTNATVRNTAQLYTGPSPRLTWTPMTRRSDSAAMATQLGTTGTREYFFTGVTQPAWTAGSPMPAGTRVFEPDVGGTIQGGVALIRGHSSDGTEYPARTLASTLVHETSHTLVASYGEHPGTSTDSGSFDRYKDEFRAYFVDPYDQRFGGLTPDRRAGDIRTLLVGASAANPAPATNAYRDLQAAYWTNATFRGQVDRHTRPDGFNLTSSPRLDQLFGLLTAAGTDASKVDDAILVIIRLPVAERTEAAAASMVETLLQPLSEPARQRVRRALGAPSVPAYTAELNPDNSPRITWFYDSLVRGDPAGITTTYGRLTPVERGRLALNAATLVFVDRHLDNVRTRACTVAMINTGSIDQFHAVDRFVGACLDELANELLGTPRTAPSPALLAALRAMAFEARIGFYRLTEDARIRYVEVLPAPIQRPLISVLRGERDP
ncbi:hypothetical protein HP550_10995 [Cellulomonas humilata]|uniref:Uncharacterized protein n=1 Tax=Cellulomonas humilata TaxID=144055 RepID=A0A7Y6A104_9CELL|nr:hypothetical protein [Cellulomonas humilata]NUU17774.1 hypothetical protein [Cellulomonas humilata]